MTRNVRYSDQRLLQMAMEAANDVEYAKLPEAVDASSSSTSRWARKKMRSTITTPSAPKIEVFTKENKAQDSFKVLAQGALPCSIQELRLVFRNPTTESFCSVMTTVGKNDFSRGHVLHHLTIANSSNFVDTSSSTISSTDGERSRHDSISCGSATQKQRASANILQELSVHSLTFDKNTLFSSDEEWSVLEYIRPHANDLDRECEGFTKTTVTLAPEDCFMDSRGIRGKKFGHDTIIGYSFTENLHEDTVRLLFLGEYIGHNKKQHGQRRGGGSRSKTDASSRLIRARLIKMAVMTNRFMLVISRRRLGMQVMADARKIRAVNTHCICCTRSFMFARRQLCTLCGYLVCDRCSRIQEREFILPGVVSQRRIHSVRVCERCMDRVNQCRYTYATEENLKPAHIVQDTAPVKTGVLLCNLLQQTLVNANDAKKASALNVIKYLLDDTDARSENDDDMRSDNLTDLSSDEEYLEALEASLKEYDVPINECVLGNNTKRSYQIAYPDDPTKPINTVIAQNETQRLEAINRLNLSVTTNLPELTTICALAADELKCLGGCIIVVKETTFEVLATTLPSFKSQTFPRNEGFCALLVLDDKPLLVQNALADVRFSQLGLVQKMGLSFYCGFPLRAADNTVIGSVCCVAEDSRPVTRSQYAVMCKLAAIASRIVQRSTL